MSAYEDEKVVETDVQPLHHVLIERIRHFIVNLPVIGFLAKDLWLSGVRTIGGWPGRFPVTGASITVPSSSSSSP